MYRSLEAVARPRLPQNVAFPHHALRRLVHSFHCYLFKFRFHGRLIFPLKTRPYLSLNASVVPSGITGLGLDTGFFVYLQYKPVPNRSIGFNRNPFQFHA